MGKKSKKSKPVLKPRLDWLELLQTQSPLPLNRLTEKDHQQKSLWQVMAESGLVPSDQIDAISTMVQDTRELQKAVNACLPSRQVSALGYAIQSDDVDMILALLHVGSNLQEAFVDGQWLHAMLRHISTVDSILAILILCDSETVRFSEDVQVYRDDQGYGLHDYALVKFANDALVQWLFEHQLFPPAKIQDEPILLWLIKHGKRDLLDAYLLCIPSDFVYAYADDGHNILTWATEKGDLELVESILSKHPHESLFEKNHHGESALHYLVRVSSVTQAHQDIMRLLLIAEMDVNAVNHEGDSVLMIALRHDKTSILSSILMISNLYVRNHKGEHCLSIALCHGHYDMAKVIIGLNRRNIKKPYNLEMQLAPLTPKYLSLIHI